MNIESVVYTKENIKSMNAKKYVLLAYIVLFSIMLLASTTIFIFLFLRGRKDILSFLLCCFSIIISVFYVVANVINIKKINILNKMLQTQDKYEQKLNNSLKVNEKSILSTTAIIFIVCNVLILLATITSVIFLCLEFSLEMLAETLFMVLILGYSSQTLITTIIEDKLYKKQINSAENN